MNQPYNPLEKRNLAESVVKQLLSVPSQPLKDLKPFTGAGIYAIYYSGGFPAYQRIVTTGLADEDATPIYVGKAVPRGARKGLDTDGVTGTALFERLKDHLGSVSAAKNLDEKDFTFRVLVVDDIWIPLAESLMINQFQPLWNVKIDGFGNHDPGGGRRNQKRSSWDVLHPGRSWTNKQAPSLLSEEQILSLLEKDQAVPESVFEASESSKDDA